MKTSSIKKNEWACMALAFALFVLLYPFFFWSIIGNKVVLLLINIITAFIFLFYRKKLTKDDYYLILLYEGVWFLNIILSGFWHGSNINGIITQIPICLYISTCVVKSGIMKKTVYYLINIVVVVSAIGLMFYLLRLLGVSLPSFGTIHHYNMERSYIIYPFFLVETSTIYMDIVRFYGVFDEPGLLGTLLVFFLFALKFDFKNWRTWICLIVGVFTFSFFFYAMMVVYWIVNLSLFKKSILSVVLACSLLGSFYYLTKDNNLVNAVLWNRFEWDSQEGKFVGDNRMRDDAEYAFNKIEGNEYLWGLEAHNVEKYWVFAYGSSSYKNVIATNGMVFFVLYMLFFILFGWKYKVSWTNYLMFLLMLFLCLYQRAEIYKIPYMFLFACLARLKDICVDTTIPLKWTNRSLK